MNPVTLDLPPINYCASLWRNYSVSWLRYGLIGAITVAIGLIALAAMRANRTKPPASPINPTSQKTTSQPQSNNSLTTKDLQPSDDLIRPPVKNTLDNLLDGPEPVDKLRVVAQDVKKTDVPIETSQPQSNNSLTTKDLQPSDDLIRPSVKNTLDTLLGCPGSVDKLPVVAHDVKKLDVPIAKGIASCPKTGFRNPFIRISMRCMSSDEEIQKSFPYGDKSKHKKGIRGEVYLYPAFKEEPLMWIQADLHKVYPIFFKGRSFIHENQFTYPDNGEVTKFQENSFELLRKCIQEGRGQDINGLTWELISNNQ
jgi:hypothetical protein